MSKLLLGVTAAVGTSVAGAGSTFVFSNASSTGEGGENIVDSSSGDTAPSEQRQNQEQARTPEVPKATGKLLSELTSSKDIGKVNSRVDCLKEYSSVSNWPQTETNSSNIDVSGLSTGTLKGCLIVEYDKETFKEQKWKGNFKAIWTLTNESNGLILVTTAQTDTGAGLFSVDGSIYVLNKTGSNWGVKNYIYKKEDNVTSEKLSNFLVQPGEAISDLKSEEYWGFKPDLNYLCQSSECEGNNNKTSLSAAWKFKEDDKGKQVNQWSKNLNELIKALFPNFFKNSDLSINKKGNWTKES